MVASVRKLLSKIRWGIFNSFTALRKIEASRRQEGIIYFDLHSNCYDRYLYQLIFFFELAGYHPVFKLTFSFLSTWSTSLILKSNKGISFSFGRPSKCLISFTDRADDSFHYFLSNNYFNSKDQNGFYVPMPMVDSLYINEAYKLSTQLAINGERSIKVFFAGNLVAHGYNREELRKYFGMPTRLETLESVMKNFSSHIVTPTSTDFWKDYDKKEIELLLVNRHVANVQPMELCRVLSRSCFFLSLPGVCMPFSHNLIEAMCFGAIPILNYAHLCHPALEDGVNCLVYSDLNNLNEKLKAALSMNSTEIDAMRKNVISYYKQYLDVGAVVNRLLQNRRDRQVNCYLNAEYFSVIQCTPIDREKNAGR